VLTLLLLRHAKSSWDDPELEDFDRPLAKRGARAAREMGAFIRKEELRPDLVLCSGAVRTRATLALVLPELGPPPPEIIHEDALYLAEPAEILAQIRRAGAARRVMVIGHNPGLHAIALSLVGDGGRRDITALATKFPTAALAVISFDGEDWGAVRPAAGRLVRYVTPRTLA
jgi:phosphohistidine phosphatase